MTRYKNKKTGKIGEVIHYKDVTTSLRFDDGVELILSPARLRNEFVLVEEEELKRLTFSELCDVMREWNNSHNSNMSAVIVYEQKNFAKPYSETARSYRVLNTCGRFCKKTSTELTGDCLDGTDDNVRLDYYNWSVEYCYID